jgi:plastocyanin
MKSTFTRLATVAATISLVVTPIASQAAVTTAFGPGDLIKGSGSTVYYFGQDGKRYVFPNDKTYFTWFSDFSKVKQIPDNMLSTIPLKNNVTYRPGKKMVKITTDPKTYVVDQGGILRHVTSESLAQTLYGLSWKNQIDDIPDPFFINYKIGTPIQTASDYNPGNTMTLTTTIAQDKQLDETKMTVTIGDKSAGFVPTSITIKKGTEVTWYNNDSSEHMVQGNGFSSSMLKYGQSWSYQFNTVGSFDYKDPNFTVMQGTVNVVN